VEALSGEKSRGEEEEGGGKFLSSGGAVEGKRLFSAPEEGSLNYCFPLLAQEKGRKGIASER